eukprot:358430-Chlamydomonas_euryale.AAC.2
MRIGTRSAPGRPSARPAIRRPAGEGGTRGCEGYECEGCECQAYECDGCGCEGNKCEVFEFEGSVSCALANTWCERACMARLCGCSARLFPPRPLFLRGQGPFVWTQTCVDSDAPAATIWAPAGFWARGGADAFENSATSTHRAPRPHVALHPPIGRPVHTP